MAFSCGKSRPPEPLGVSIYREMGASLSPRTAMARSAGTDGRDGVELLALFINANTRTWIAWTPPGYYLASPRGEDLVGWHVNRGWDQAADFFPGSRSRARFNRPDIARLVLETLDEGAALRRADAAAGRHDEVKPLETALPPVIKILSPQIEPTFKGATVDVTYSLRAPSGRPIDSVEILIDGSPTGARTLGLDPKGSTEEIKQTVTIGLPPRDVDVGLVAKSGNHASEIAHLKLAY